MSMNIVGIGACVSDTLMTVPEYPAEDTKMRAVSSVRSGGGPVSTGLVAAAKLGASAGFIGTLSDDSDGRFLAADFKKYGVSCSRVRTVPGTRSFTSVIWLSKAGGSRTCVFDRGTLPPTELTGEDLDTVAAADILMGDGNDLDAAVAAAEHAKKHGTKVLYDAGGRYEGVGRLIPLADYLIPSREFALGVTGEKDPEKAAAALYREYRPDAAIVTCGSDGGVLCDAKGIFLYPCYPVEVVDSNGSGDVFHGAFAAGLLRGYGLRECCHYASAVAALKCTKTGARGAVPEHNSVINFWKENDYDL